jgi:hypothetical protein
MDVTDGVYTTAERQGGGRLGQFDHCVPGYRAISFLSTRAAAGRGRIADVASGKHRLRSVLIIWPFSFD